ncbi:G-patch domain and KOW motifs-containing protein-like [Saccostrea echinata]|uniref:G-patch domain and KOW motifs-containing protein-like n=1 Tax=Saccostrea echinata TaxID=191078 RepID=UPI002A83F401|nr:G-patch domain and KOW motifs-containing protein-like [Saccostrea echinata]
MAEMKPLSFGFSKKFEKKDLSKSVAAENEKKEDDSIDYVTSVDNKTIKGSKPEKEKKEYVIPLIKKNDWRSGLKSDKQRDEAEDEAVKEIIEDAARKNEAWKEQGKVDNTDLAIPLLMQNKVPEGFETDEKLDVSLRPDEPEEADYEEIPIESFGVAMLKGMGWKEGDGIGKNKKNFTPVVATLRPKGLGLGADISEAKQAKWNGEDKGKDKEEEILTVKKGAYCVLTKGANKDLYGVIEGLDEDNARVMVKLTLSGKIVTQSQYGIRLVRKKEYVKYSKYLNKGKSDEYKEKESQKNGSRKRSRSRSRERSHKKSHRHRSRSKDRSHRQRSRSRSKERSHRHVKGDRRKENRERGRSNEREERNGERRLHEEEKSHREDRRTQDYEDREEQVSRRVQTFSEIWARPQIRVRIIDKNYKKGNYYKNKVTVLDVPGPENCICKTEDGKVLEGLSQLQLETVIPKSDRAFVLIVSGKFRGQLGEVMSRNKKKSTAAVQLLQDRDSVLNISYDHICEFVGDIQEEFDY